VINSMSLLKSVYTPKMSITFSYISIVH
jgi:hypothetical protein